MHQVETVNRNGHQCVDTEIDYNYSGWDGREKKTPRYCALVVKKNQSEEKHMGVQAKKHGRVPCRPHVIGQVNNE